MSIGDITQWGKLVNIEPSPFGTTYTFRSLRWIHDAYGLRVATSVVKFAHEIADNVIYMATTGSEGMAA